MNGPSSAAKLPSYILHLGVETINSSLVQIVKQIYLLFILMGFVLKTQLLRIFNCVHYVELRFPNRMNLKNIYGDIVGSDETNSIRPTFRHHSGSLLKPVHQCCTNELTSDICNVVNHLSTCVTAIATDESNLPGEGIK